MTSEPIQARREWRFSSRLLALAGVAVLAALCLAGFAVLWAAYASDRVSVERQVRVVRHVIDAELGRLAHD